MLDIEAIINQFERQLRRKLTPEERHLLRELPQRGLATYHGKGDHAVEAVRYSSEDQSIMINKTQFFKPVQQAVWEFHVGGYPVLDKYLK